MFSTLSKTNFSVSDTLILSSADVFNLDQSKTLSFGKELMHIQDTLFSVIDHMITDPQKSLCHIIDRIKRLVGPLTSGKFTNSLGLCQGLIILHMH